MFRIPRTVLGVLSIALCAVPAAAGPVISLVKPSEVYTCVVPTGPAANAEIRGTGFVSGATVTLKMAGEADIPVEVVAVFSATKIGVTWPYASLSVGAWDVVVTNPDQTVGVAPGGLVVNECPPFELTGLGPSHAFACGPRAFHVAGVSLDKTSTIRLTRPGEPDIVGTSLTWERAQAGLLPAWVKGSFDIAPGTAGGLWSLEYSNANGQVTLADAIEIDPDCPRGAAGDLYVANTDAHNILQFDTDTGDLVCVFAEAPPEVEWPSAYPHDLVWMPNGNLMVAWQSLVAADGRFVAEYDGDTGAFVGYIVPRALEVWPAFDSITVGGAGGMDFFVQKVREFNNYVTERFDGVTRSSMGVEFHPTELPVPAEPTLPYMIRPCNIRMNLDGNIVLTGGSDGSPQGIVRRYDLDPGTGEYHYDTQFVGLENLQDFIETPDGCCYLVANQPRNRIDRYDRETLEFIDVYIPEALPGAFPSTPGFYEAMRSPYDLQFGPNGNLFVIANSTPVPSATGQGEIGYGSSGQVHEFDPQTLQQVRIFGGWNDEDPYSVFDPNPFLKLFNPQALEFKPMPGDFTSCGGAFHGDWVVDENDLARFAAALDGTSPGYLTGANLLSFDMNRDGVVDCGDWPLFAAAFEASSGYAPQIPLPCAPCVADVTTQGAGVGDPGYGVPDGQVTGSDIQYYVNLWVAQDLDADLTTTGAGVGDPGYGVPDGAVTAADINYFVNIWVLGCP